MQLAAIFTDRDGDPLGVPRKFSDWTVEIPVNDARTGKVVVSCYDPIAAHVKPLETCVKFMWGPHLALNGPITDPVFRPDGSIEVNVEDPTFWLHHHFSRYGDLAVVDGYSVDGNGLWVLMADARATDYQLGLGVLDLPMIEGGSWRQRQEELPLGPQPVQTRKATRGMEVWEQVIDTAGLFQGPDFDVRPVDENHPPTTGQGGSIEVAWEPGLLAQLDLYDQMMVDRSRTQISTPPVLFQAGFGHDNMEWPEYAPSGQSIRNSMVIVKQGGDKEDEPAARGDYFDVPSQQLRGIVEGWESSGNDKDPVDVLEEKAELYVKLYKDPLPNLVLKPRANAPAWPTAFYHGDVIRAQAKRGFAPLVDHRARVMKVTLMQDGDTRQGVQEVEVNPFRAGDLLGANDLEEEVPSGGNG